ncbi:MAG TPA: YceI family protein [Phnomibacter sp.]|nr:YceI family protein [Phnomibacter sp.]
MKTNLLTLAMALITVTAFSQKLTTTSAVIAFDATTPLDKLPKAENKTVIASVNTQTGAVAFEALIKNFAFSNPRIQEHFNQPNWMDSDKYPTATFTGKITNLAAVNFSKNGTYTADVEGDLTMHGQTKPIKTKAYVTVNGKSVRAMTEFEVKLADFSIDGPAVGAGKVAKDPKINVLVDF